jgi:nascent polypeptide-associated complex subunit beta
MMLQIRKCPISFFQKFRSNVEIEPIAAVVASLMSRGSVGAKTGGKGSWRRKEKKVKKGGNVEGAKLWQAAQRLGCRAFGPLDSASFIFGAQDEALSFDKPELAFDMHANTFVLQGNSVKKPMVEILQDLVSTLDLSKRIKGDVDAEGHGEATGGDDDDLGVSTDVDFGRRCSHCELKRQFAHQDSSSGFCGLMWFTASSSDRRGS